MTFMERRTKAEGFPDPIACWTDEGLGGFRSGRLLDKHKKMRETQMRVEQREMDVVLVKEFANGQKWS